MCLDECFSTLLSADLYLFLPQLLDTASTNMQLTFQYKHAAQYKLLIDTEFCEIPNIRHCQYKHAALFARFRFLRNSDTASTNKASH